MNEAAEALKIETSESKPPLRHICEQSQRVKIVVHADPEAEARIPWW